MMSDYALFRMPYAQQAYRVGDGTQQPVVLTSAQQLDDVSGFVMAPFVATPQHPILVIPGEAQPYTLATDSYMSHGVEHYSREDYSHAFARFHDAIVEGRFSKLVLSRCSEVDMDTEIDPERFFSEACHRYPRMMIALVRSDIAGTWLMATPEILIAQDGDRWNTMALAGTMRYEGEQDYQWSAKNIAEQEMVVRYVDECLRPLAIDINIGNPYTVRAGNLVHLRTDISFRLSPDSPHGIGTIVDALHPTPAVCGLPKREAMSFIIDNESIERKYYSGYLGPWNIAGQSSLYVSLRCMQMYSHKYILHAGGGLLKESNEESEWRETMMKMQAMRNLWQK